jgi:hypothetical protein
VKEVILEMGGKNAAVIDEDADLDEAVGEVVASAFGYQGRNARPVHGSSHRYGKHRAPRLCTAGRDRVKGGKMDIYVFAMNMERDGEAYYRELADRTANSGPAES